MNSYEQHITSRPTYNRVDSLRHKSSSDFFDVIGTNVFLLKQDNFSARKFRESFSSVNGREIRCALVAKMKSKLLAVRGNQQTTFHQLAALGLENNDFDMESSFGK